MKNNKFQLQIVKPCAESSEKMDAHPEGLYCQTCQKKVVDFTTKLPLEIALFFTQHRSESVCGQFNEDQLAEDYPFLDENPKKPALKYAASFLASMLLAKQVTAQKVALKPPVEQSNYQNNDAENVPILPKSLIIKGQVTDEATGKGIKNVQLVVTHQDTIYYDGATDANGFYEFQITDTFNIKTILSVYVSSGKYQSVVLNLRQFIDNQSNSIILNVPPPIPISNLQLRGNVERIKPCAPAKTKTSSK
jgi:hypothetical protein